MDLEEVVLRLRASNDETVRLVAGLDGDQWRYRTQAEAWPVGVTARHIGLGHRQFAGWVRAMTTDGRVEPGDIDAVNAREAARGIVSSPDEVALLIRDEGDRVVAALSALTAADVAGEVDFGGRRVPRAALLAESVRHVDRHTASIRETLGLGGDG